MLYFRKDLWFMKVYKVLLQSLTSLILCNTLVLNPSVLTTVLLLLTHQLKILEISFAKLRLKIFEAFLFK